MKVASIITIPRTITGREELVIIPRKMLERLIAREVAAADVLKWSREAKKLKRESKLPLLRSLKDLR